MRKFLYRTISYHDYSENFYHALLVGLFALDERGTACSNVESGLGRPDLLVVDEDNGKAVIIEVKVAATEQQLEAAALQGLTQIRTRRYAQPLLEPGEEQIFACGIAFWKRNVWSGAFCW